MKRVFFLLPLILGVISCNQQSTNTQQLQNQIDSLKNKLSDVYKPGFGEFMGYVQAHHVKLWFAGKNKNWDLANFEMDEIRETFESIEKYETDREETQLVPMINSALDSVTAAISEKNVTHFTNSFQLLTNTCNECHTATKFQFNKVKIPTEQTFSNQDFKPAK